MTFLAICDKSELGKYLADKPKYADYKQRCDYIVVVTTLSRGAKKPFTMSEIHHFVLVGGVMQEHSTFDNTRSGFQRRGRSVMMTAAETKLLVGTINLVLDNYHRMNNKLYFVAPETKEVYFPRVNMLPLNELHNPTWEFTDVDLRREMLFTLK